MRTTIRGVAALLAVTMLLGTACKPAAPRTFNPEGLAGPKIDPPVPKPDFILTDTDGKPFNFRKETEGKVALLFFGQRWTNRAPESARRTRHWLLHGYRKKY